MTDPAPRPLPHPGPPPTPAATLAAHQARYDAAEYAGWTAALSGCQVDYSGNVFRGGEVVSRDVLKFAARLLGITVQQADRLFFVDDDEIAVAVERVFGPRPGGAS